MNRSHKQNKAVALRYHGEEDMAPIVIAAGYGHTADKIIDIAEQEGIPVFRDDSAASLLCMLEVGETIPIELYQVVAAVYKNLVVMAAEIKGKQPDTSLQQNKAGRYQRLQQLQQATQPSEP